MLEEVLGQEGIHTYKESCIHFCISELEKTDLLQTLAAGYQLLTLAAPALLPISGGLGGLGCSCGR